MENPLEDHVNDRPHEEVPNPEQGKPLRAKRGKRKEHVLSSGDEEPEGKQWRKL